MILDADDIVLRHRRHKGRAVAARRGDVDGVGKMIAMEEISLARRDHRMLDRVSPMAAPLLLEISKVPIRGEGRERLARIEAETLMREAGLEAVT